MDKLKFISRATTLLIFTFLIIIIPISEASAADNWLTAGITVTIPKDKTTDKTAVKIRLNCTAGQVLDGTPAKCPSDGNFEYTIPKSTESNGQVVFKRSIIRNGTTQKPLPRTDWKTILTYTYYAIGSEHQKDIPKITDDTKIIFDNTGEPVVATPTDLSAGAETVESGGTTPKEPLGVSLSKIKETDSPSVTPTSNCPTGKFEKGILTGLSCNGPIKNLSDVIVLIKNILFNFIMPAVGVLFLIVMIVGGILYISSAGNQTQIDRAKKTLTAGVIGLIIVISSYAIIRVAISLMGGGVS